MDRTEADDLPGLYIHIPFCIQKCGYCSFYSVTDKSLIPNFLDALRREMRLCRDDGSLFDTLYIGGGTPSLLTEAELGLLIADIRTVFAITPDAEITIEANPADITVKLLTALRDSGVNRLNIGVQSLDDRVLSFLGRRHDRELALSSVESARNAGIENIGLDLIYGVPGQTLASWMATLRGAVALGPDHLSCYQLSLETQTPLAKRCRREGLRLPDETLQADFFLNTSELLEDVCFIHYEASNFARPGKESRHNRKYWNHTPYLGLGPSAHSFSGRERMWNRRSVDTYIGELAAGRRPVEASESLTQEQLRLEVLFLGFRTRRGIDLERYNARFGQDLLKEKAVILKKLPEEGLAEIQDGFLRPTRAGIAVADSLALI
jgi:oxygen-independent coproporphyrinogen-3 oxidase